MTEINDSTLDAIVSVSPIEQNPDHEQLKIVIKEFEQVLKPEHPMTISTSAVEKGDYFHKPAQGWYYSAETLADIFYFEDHESNMNDYLKVYDNIFNCDDLNNNLSKTYSESEFGDMPHGVWKPEYIPVGVLK